jgi:DNA-binding transcriptional regulator YiaG
VAETPIFRRYAVEVWSEAERSGFISFIAANPESGDAIRGSGGCRKVRWSTSGQGKSGGARVIYFNANDGTVWLLIVYKKAKFDNLPTTFLAELKQGAAEARASVGLSQQEFAILLGVSSRTLQDWEQGRREPTGAAKTLLRVAASHPEILRALNA